jgi:hypothetical protein
MTREIIIKKEPKRNLSPKSGTLWGELISSLPEGGGLPLADFARQAGVTPQAIRKAALAGRIDGRHLFRRGGRVVISPEALSSYLDQIDASGQTRGAGGDLAGTKLQRELVKLEGERLALEERKRNLVPTQEVAALFHKWNLELAAALKIFAEAAGRALAPPGENWVATRNEIARLLNPVIESWGIAVSETDSPAAAKLLDALAGLQKGF